VQAHLGLGGSRSWGGEHAGVGIQRRPAAVSAAARSPARRAHGVDNARPWEVPRALGSILGAQVVKGTAGGGGAPAAAAMARRAVGDGSVDAVGRESDTPFIERVLGDDGVVTTAVPSCYGALAGARTTGAADGPVIRRAHCARTTAQRRGSRRLDRRDASGGGA
jgi:hypothetical protein